MRSLITVLFLLLALRLDARLTQSEAQRKLDDAVRAADEIVVSDFAVRRADESVYTYDLWSSSDPSEVRRLSSYVQLRFDPAGPTWVCGCDGAFTVTLKRKHVVTFEFRVYHEDSIACDQIVERSHLHIDKRAFAPFWSRMEERLHRAIQALHPDVVLLGAGPIREKKANQPPEPTALSVTICACAQLAPASTVAHL